MKKIDLGQAIQILADIGVILGIVFLAFELHQNNELLESQANVQLLENRIRGSELLVSDDALGEAVLKSRAGKALSDLELLKLDNHYGAMLQKWEWEFRQYTKGLIEGQNLPINDWRAIFSLNPRLNELWRDSDFRARYSDDFAEFLERNVASP